MTWTDHPLIDLQPEFRRLSDAEFAALADGAGQDAALAYVAAREKRIADATRDPFRHEFPLPHWAEVEDLVQRKTVTFIPGGNNPGKSWWSGSLVMRFLLRQFAWDGLVGDTLKVLMISQDEDASTMFQQPSVYAHFPLEWRVTNERAKKPPGFAKCINYSDKNGFTEGKFVLPKGGVRGQCFFKTVAQYTREPKSFEGPAYHLVIVDEGCPPALFHSLCGRAAKLGGKIIYLLTCVHGYDATMAMGLEGAKILKTLPMQHDLFSGAVNPKFAFPELKVGEHQTDLLKRLNCPAGHLPVMMQPLNPHWGVFFFWTTFNCFQPRAKWNPLMPSLCDAAVGQPRWKALVIMFGWIERVGQLALGNFNPEIHIVRGEAREALDKLVREGKGTVYMSDDPETQRSHAILWQATFPGGQKYLFDESPRANEGPWVDANGQRGDGQYCYASTGANWYKKYIRNREIEWNICDQFAIGNRKSEIGNVIHACVIQRRGDPRGFATEESTATGTRSMFELYLEDHSTEHPDCAPMVFFPAKIRRSSSLDLDNIINLLRYDEERAHREGGLSVENRPVLLVSERCENFIRCALNYTLTDLGKADEDNPFRDFIDSMRYLNSADTPFVDAKQGVVSAGGSWG